MKLPATLILLLLVSGAAFAQGSGVSASPVQSVTKGAWELSVIGGGGPGLGASSNTQFAFAGARIGRVLTGSHFSGWRQGNFEWAVDLLPLYEVFTSQGAVYGGGFKPVIWQWNFTRGRRIAPYVAVAGGVLFTRGNVPPGNTSWVNFTPQGSFGAHIFLRNGRALLIEGSAVHHSNASLGTLNPGYNAALFFTVGYSWFRGGR